MDAPWEAVTGEQGGFLNEFSDDLLLNLDSDTLNALVSTQNPEQAGTSSKRPRLEDQNASLSNFLTRLQNDEAIGGESFDVAESSKSDGEDDGRGKGKRELSQAARNKACRERARRERLNEGFMELAKLIDHGKQAKPDKASIVADAVRVITQLRAENNQLKQLNKFLEEKVSEAEKQKGQSLLQALFQQQATLQQQVLLQSQPALLAQQYVASGVPVGLLPQQFHNVQGLNTSNNLGGSMTAVATVPTLPGVANLANIQGLTLPIDANMNAKPNVQGYTHLPDGVSGLPMSASSWLPPSTLDISQDHKLRPPAA